MSTEPRQTLIRSHITGRQEQIKKLLLSPQTHATPLLVLCLDRFPEMLGQDGESPWAPETVRLECQAEFQATLPDYNLDKIMALMTVLTSDLFFVNLPSFIQLCNVLSGDTFDPAVFDPATCAEMAWGITEVLLLEPPDSDEPFSDEIRRYIGAMLVEEGFHAPPDVLRIAIFDEARGDPLNVWSDDPELYQMGFAVQQEKKADVEALLRDNVMELSLQLKSLPLENGSTEALMQKWQNGLRSLEQR